MHDAHIISWILSFMDSQIVLNLWLDNTARGMWDYLKRVYNEEILPGNFQLKYEVVEYTRGNKSVQEYYS